MSLKDRTRRYLLDAARAFEHAPLEVATAVFLAAMFSYAVEVRGEVMRDWFQLAVACTLLLAGSWTGTLLHALGAWSMRARWTAAFAGAAAAVAYLLLIPTIELVSELWRAALLVAATVLWILAVPALARGMDTPVDRIRNINGRILLRVMGALLYTAALYAGLALALAAIDNLFELNLEGFVYAHVFGWLFIVLAPWIVVGGVPDYVRPDATRREVATVVHRMTGYLVPPLLALYHVILYAYAVRIAVTGEIPKNLVSPMVLAAGGLVALALYLFEPRPDTGAGSRFLQFTPLLFLPLSALGMWAILLRVGQYGWTEFRLLRLLVLAVLGMLAMGATSLVLRRRRLALHVAPLLAAVLLVLAAIGPWSVLNAARRSQQARLDEVMRNANVSLTTSAASDSAPRIVPAEIYDQLRSTTQYLARHFGPEALPPALARRIADRSDVFDLPRLLDLQRGPDAGGELDRPLNGQLVADATLQLGAVTMQRLVIGPGRGAGDGPAINAIVDSTRVRIHHGNEVLTADLGPLLRSLDTGPEGRFMEFTGEQAQIALTDVAGRRRGQLVVLSFHGQMRRDSLQLNRMEALLLLEAAARD